MIQYSRTDGIKAYTHTVDNVSWFQIDQINGMEQFLWEYHITYFVIWLFDETWRNKIN